MHAVGLITNLHCCEVKRNGMQEVMIYLHEEKKNGYIFSACGEKHLIRVEQMTWMHAVSKHIVGTNYNQ
jgi:hypothetical protein